MKKAGITAALLIMLISSLLYSEDIILVKHARKPDPVREITQYKIKQGDTLKKIFLKDFQARPQDLPGLYREFRQYNPGVRNLDRILPGKKVTIPGIPSRKKPAPASADKANVYVMKKGQHLAMILREMYGLPDDLIFHKYLDEIRQLNPEIQNLDLVVAGQKIRLPEIKQENRKIPAKTPAIQALGKGPGLKKVRKFIVQEIDDANGEQETAQNRSAEDSPGRKGQGEPSPQALQGQQEMPDGNGKGQGEIVTTIIGGGLEPENDEERAATQLVRNSILPSLKEMGVRQRDHGTYFLPLTGDKSLSLDTSVIPVIDLDNGSRIILDVNGKILKETKRLIEETYPSTKVISGPSEGLEPLMERILDACGYFSVNKDAGPILVGEDEKVRFSGKWVVYKDSSRRNIIVVNLLSDGEYKTPESIRRYAARFGINLIEMGGKQGLPRKEGILPALDHSYEKLLSELGVAYEKQKVLDIVSVDALSISFMAPLLIDRAILTSEQPDKTMLDLLQKRGYKVINLKNESLGKILDALGKKKQGPPIRVIVAKNRTEIDLPAIEVNGTIILEHPLDKDITSYLHASQLKIVIW